MHTYPRFAYHKDLAIDGKLIRSAEEEPTGPGWVDTPAAFEKGYQAPKPEADGTPHHPAASKAPLTGQPYPAWRHNEAGEARLVHSKDEDNALGKGWTDTPAKHDPVAEKPAKPVAPTTPAPKLSEAEEKAAAEKLAAKAKELHATPVDEIEDALAESTDREHLNAVKQMEALNPRGPRISLVKFIDKRLTDLQAP